MTTLRRMHGTSGGDGAEQQKLATVQLETCGDDNDGYDVTMIQSWHVNSLDMAEFFYAQIRQTVFMTSEAAADVPADELGVDE